MYLRAALSLNKHSVAQAAARLVSLRPVKVVMAHGRPFEGDATAELGRALSWVLPSNMVASEVRPAWAGRFEGRVVAGVLSVAALGAAAYWASGPRPRKRRT
jgi:hypothetical protein